MSVRDAFGRHFGPRARLGAAALSATALLVGAPAQAAPPMGGAMIGRPIFDQPPAPSVQLSEPWRDPAARSANPGTREGSVRRVPRGAAFWRAVRGSGAFAPGYWTHTLPLAPLYAVPTRKSEVGMIVTSVMINGRGPFRFMLDTGATRTVLASSTVSRLGLKINPADRILVRGVSGVTTVPVVHVSSVVSGALQLRDLAAPVLSGPVFNGLDGILGMDGLAGMRLTADFVRDRVVISPSAGRAGTQPTAGTAAGAGVAARAGTAAGAGVADSPLFTTLQGQFVSQRLLLVRGRIDGVQTAAVIDTGATHSLGNAALLALLTHDHAPVLRAKDGVIDATDTTEAGSMQRIASMRLGNTAITNLHVIFGNYSVFKTWGLQDKPALLLGMDVLGSVADFSIDYGRAELQVLPWLPLS
ncbi:MAG TPA: retropepsin-like aspartic protease [Steroidobacteraceae bacterium]|nr:retropepsin-like aspartic protease [Steroidobacteraceae bacterium]